MQNAHIAHIHIGGILKAVAKVLPNAVRVRDYFHHVKNQRDNVHNRRGGKLAILGARTM